MSVAWLYTCKTASANRMLAVLYAPHSSTSNLRSPPALYMGRGT
eukprot:CAMPEP_0171885670 /NCGR_PEP_ID=MMETSP0992-20121227/41464_1 /TAXON_ID=483369 /ORGANISM="non described non described, Strain CCMP2098" /LENGTH=43 /DNA_ID= /DNA_START= /DNA_END= /DNA_ORIENTATION=